MRPSVHLTIALQLIAAAMPSVVPADPSFSVFAGTDHTDYNVSDLVGATLSPQGSPAWCDECHVSTEELDEVDRFISTGHRRRSSAPSEHTAQFGVACSPLMLHLMEDESLLIDSWLQVDTADAAAEPVQAEYTMDRASDGVAFQF